MPASPQPLKVFVSAAENSADDEARWQRLEKQLAILRRQGLIEIWDKGDVTAGTERVRAVGAQLEAARIVLLLISPDFLAADNIFDDELQRALERHKAGTARVIPVILRPCPWQ